LVVNYTVEKMISIKNASQGAKRFLVVRRCIYEKTVLVSVALGVTAATGLPTEKPLRA
jgi:hypothetical protein